MWSLVTVMRNCGIHLFYETVKHCSSHTCKCKSVLTVHVYHYTGTITHTVPGFEILQYINLFIKYTYSVKSTLLSNNSAFVLY